MSLDPSPGGWDRFALAHPVLSHAVALAWALFVYAVLDAVMRLYDYRFPFPDVDL